MENIYPLLFVMLVWVNAGATCTSTDTSLTKSICAGDTFYIGSHAYTGAGTYMDTLTNAGGCDSIVILALTVTPLPAVSLTVTCEMAGVDVCWWSSSLIAQSTNSDSIGWQLNGNLIGNATGDTLSLSAGGYNLPGTIIQVPLGQPQIVCFTAYNNCGSATVCDTIMLVGEGITTIPSANLFTLYPNPADDYTMIDFEAAYTDSPVYVRDITGRQLFETKLNTSPQQIPTGNLSPGMYLVTMYSNWQMGARLLVKE